MIYFNEYVANIKKYNLIQLNNEEENKLKIEYRKYLLNLLKTNIHFSEKFLIEKEIVKDYDFKEIERLIYLYLDDKTPTPEELIQITKDIVVNEINLDYVDLIGREIQCKIRQVFY